MLSTLFRWQIATVKLDFVSPLRHRYWRLTEAGRHTLSVALLMSAGWIVSPSAFSDEVIAKNAVDGVPGLASAISIALNFYPSIRAADANVESQQAAVDQARYGHWPTVSYQASRQLTSDDQSNYPRSFSGSPVAKLNLYAGGGINAQVQAQLSRLDAAEYHVANERDSVALRAAQAYIDWFRTSEALRYAKENALLHEKLTNDMGDMATIDRGRLGDYQQAQVRLATARQTVVDFQSLQAQAQSTLFRFTGRLPISPGNMSDEVIDSLPIPATLAQAQQEVVRNQPGVLAAEAEWRARQDGVTVAKAALLPHVDLQAQTKGKSVAVSLTWAGFDPAARSGVSAAQSAASASYSSYEETTRSAVDAVTSAWSDYQRARDRLPMAVGQDQLGEDVAEVYKLQFQIGRRTLLDLLNSYSEHLSNQINALQTQADLASARYRLQAVLGHLQKAYIMYGSH